MLYIYIYTCCNTNNKCIHTKMFVFSNGTIPCFEELMREREERSQGSIRKGNTFQRNLQTILVW